MDDLVKRLRLIAKQHSETSRMMAEAKSLRQPGNAAGDKDLYMWPMPEQTIEWLAADRIEKLEAENAQLRLAASAKSASSWWRGQIMDDVIKLHASEETANMISNPKRGDKLKWARSLDRRPLAITDLEHVTVASFGEVAPLAITLQEVAGVFPLSWFDRIKDQSHGG